MKYLFISLIALFSQTEMARASIATNRLLTCTYTKATFNAKPEIVAQFKYIEKPGYLPAAQGVFNVPSENITVNVSSELIYVPENKSEHVKTGIRVISKFISLSTSFSSKVEDQLSYIQINNSGYVLCRAN